METQKAVLVELFGLLLVMFGGFNLTADTYLFSNWDLVGDMTVWMTGGVIVGLYGLLAGVRSDE